MNEILKLDNIFQYNDMMGQETLHPLVSVVDFSKCKPMLHSLQRFGFYAVFFERCEIIMIIKKERLFFWLRDKS